MDRAHTSKNGDMDGATAGSNGSKVAENKGLTASAAASFNFEGATIRMVWVLGVPWFLAADVCRALQIASSNGSFSSALRKLREHEKRQVDREQFFSGQSFNDWGIDSNNSQSVWLISESSLYFLALRCRGATRPGTTAFRSRDWVTAEVLPTIRKTGSYSVNPGNAEQLSFDPTEQARYVVAVVPGKPPHVRKTQLDAMLDEWSAFDTEILANHMRTVDALWQKTQLVRSVGGDPADSPLYNRLGKAISDARRIADECLDSVRQQPV